jgi:hypothetical protein
VPLRSVRLGNAEGGLLGDRPEDDFQAKLGLKVVHGSVLRKLDRRRGSDERLRK